MIGTIRQAHLRRLKELREQVRELGDEHDALREKILGQHEAGADLGPGPLAYRVERSESRRLSQARVREALEAALEEILEAIRPTVSKRLKIEAVAARVDDGHDYGDARAVAVTAESIWPWLD